MEFLVFNPCKANPDIWMRKAKHMDNTDYQEYVLLYIDDCICISTEPEKIVCKEIGKYFLTKEVSIEEPDIYLGGKVRKVELETEEIYWALAHCNMYKKLVKTFVIILRKGMVRI